MENNKIGMFIQQLRKEKSLTQQELGDKLFVTDKAVSKWERGISLPDIAILENLAKELDVDVSEILSGKKGKKKIDIDQVLEEERNKIKNNNRKKIIIISIPIILIIILLVFLLFKHIYLGYNLKTINYNHTYYPKDIEIGIPKLSFMMKNNDRSYSYKNLRSATVLETEIKRYLKTLEYVNCNDTIYYYDIKNDFTIINYGVKDNLFYSTISYEIIDGDYCFIKKSKEYTEKLNYLRGIHNMNGYVKAEEEWDSKLTVTFQDDIDMEKRPYKFVGELLVTYHTNKKKNRMDYQSIPLEASHGEFEIKGNKLYYYRKKITKQDESITLPEVSTFNIEDGKLILVDNYLKDYHDSDIVLK